VRGARPRFRAGLGVPGQRRCFSVLT
jgi:Endoribonuclease L-PSP